jgi:hypothetical protein
MLSGAIGLERLQAIFRRCRQIPQFHGGVQLVKFATSHRPQRLRAASPSGTGIRSIKYILSPVVCE